MKLEVAKVAKYSTRAKECEIGLSAPRIALCVCPCMAFLPQLTCMHTHPMCENARIAHSSNALVCLMDGSQGLSAKCTKDRVKRPPIRTRNPGLEGPLDF